MERLNNNETEDDKTRRVLKVVQGPNWDFLQNLTSIVDNPYYTPSGKPHAFTGPHVTELKPDPPDFEPPQSDAIAA